MERIEWGLSKAVLMGFSSCAVMLFRVSISFMPNCNFSGRGWSIV